MSRCHSTYQSFDFTRITGAASFALPAGLAWLAPAWVMGQERTIGVLESGLSVNHQHQDERGRWSHRTTPR